ncbi:ABC transporter ATP-binding protein [Marinilabilia rubra]|uniref:Multidrug ABC transporter ATP-binding protein n=1 Tax=Marinilabilia rubra TaxID=2162893 RepID=A0A2U2B3J0_9BACT|nr:ABC transporter ATP-binding protein [Marinilabilia rubra]PWD97631.1 multidrug ABC transporter ATP-binding protein [Marinilabilia rubra]
MELDIKLLNKTYRNGHRALQDVNLFLEEGMFGLLGPNGAGKSTLMRTLVTLQEPSSGEVTIDGLSLSSHRKEIRQILGYLPQDFRFFPKLKSWEFLDYAASLAGIRSKKERRAEVEKMLHQVGLTNARDRFANKLSGGMKRRLGIAQALIGDPKLIIVDEPTTGLDPEERIRFRNILSNLSQQGVIIILSTHIVADISSTCRNMALLDEGKVKYQGGPESFIDKAKGMVWRANVGFDALKEVKEKHPVITTIPSVEGYEVELIASDKPTPDATMIDPGLEHAYVCFMEKVVDAEMNV